VTGNLKDVPVDGAIHVEDARTIAMLFHMREREGLALGASSCLNLVGAVDLAKQLGPGHTIVTMLCDTASKYHSRYARVRWYLFSVSYLF
jgi:cysteine synthase A